jgi:hypothetical protein
LFKYTVVEGAGADIGANVGMGPEVSIETGTAGDETPAGAAPGLGPGRTCRVDVGVGAGLGGFRRVCMGGAASVLGGLL